MNPDHPGPPLAPSSSGRDASHSAKTPQLSFASKSHVNRIILGLVLVVAGILIGSIPFMTEVKVGKQVRQAIVLGVIGVSLGCLFIYSALRFGRIHATTSADGLSLDVNGVVERCSWGDIAQVREICNQSGDMLIQLQQFAQGTNHIFEVTCHDGHVLKFNNLIADLPRLGSTIQDATLPHLYPAAFESVCQGASATFGSVSVDQHQITAGPNLMLAWPQVQEIKIESGNLQVHQVGQKGAWCTKSLNEVPNAHVLLRLASMLQAAAAADPELAARAMDFVAAGEDNAADRSMGSRPFLIVLGGLAIVCTAVLGGVNAYLSASGLGSEPVLVVLSIGFLILGAVLILLGLKKR
jgi:hypothetical protein